MVVLKVRLVIFKVPCWTYWISYMILFLTYFFSRLLDFVVQLPTFLYFQQLVIWKILTSYFWTFIHIYCYYLSLFEFKSYSKKTQKKHRECWTVKCRNLNFFQQININFFIKFKYFLDLITTFYYFVLPANCWGSICSISGQFVLAHIATRLPVHL